MYGRTAMVGCVALGMLVCVATPAAAQDYTLTLSVAYGSGTLDPAEGQHTSGEGDLAGQENTENQHPRVGNVRSMHYPNWERAR